MEGSQVHTVQVAVEKIPGSLSPVPSDELTPVKVDEELNPEYWRLLHTPNPLHALPLRNVGCTVKPDTVDIGTQASSTSTPVNFFGLSPEEVASLEEKLQDAQLADLFRIALRQLASGRLPVDHISHVCFLERAFFQSLETTTRMRYSEQTKNFWTVVYFVLGGLGRRLFSGPKNFDQILSGEATPGHFDPLLSKTNFAVPNKQVLIDYSKNLRQLHLPGHLDEMYTLAEQLAAEGARFVLSFDLKTVAEGLAPEFGLGDVSFFSDYGEETEIEKQKEEYLEMETTISSLNQELLHGNFHHKVLDIIFHLSCQGQALVSRLQQIDVNISKLEKRTLAAERFKYAMSKWNVKKYDVQNALSAYLPCVGEVCYLLSFFRGTRDLFCIADERNPLDMRNLFVLLDPSQYVNSLSKCLVQSSSIGKALGFSTLESCKAHMREVKAGRLPPVETFNILSSGVSTFVGRFSPTFLPACAGAFQGCPVSFSFLEDTEVLGVLPHLTLKCCFPSCQVHDDEDKSIGCAFLEEVPEDGNLFQFPKEKAAELFAHMAASQSDSVWLVRYNMRSAVFFKCPFDPSLWDSLQGILRDVYGTVKLRIPTKLHAGVDEVRSSLNEWAAGISHYVELPLVHSTPNTSCVRYADSMWKTFSSVTPRVTLSPLESFFKSPEDIVLPEESTQAGDHSYHSDISSTVRIQFLQLLETTSTSISAVHLGSAMNLRTAASEIGVFMLSNVDRPSRSEEPASFPIAYCMKGASITNEDLRTMVSGIRKRCEELKIPVVAEVYDGQFLQFCLTSERGFPLSDLRVRRSIWQDVCASAVADLFHSLYEDRLYRSIKHFRIIKSLEYRSHLPAGMTHASLTSAIQRDLPEIADVASKDLAQKSLKRKKLSPSTEALLAILQDAEALKSSSFEDLKAFLQAISAKYNLQSVVQHARKSDITSLLLVLLGFPPAALLSFDDHQLGTPASLTSQCQRFIFQDARVLFQLRSLSAEVLWIKSGDKWKEINPGHRASMRIEWPSMLAAELVSCSCTFEVDEEKKPIIRTFDPTHILNNIRKHMLENKLPFCPAQLLRNIADEDPEVLSKAIAYDNIDPQNVRFSKRVVSSKVQTALFSRGFGTAAKFIQVVRQWYDAVDTRGITADERVRKMIAVLKFFRQQGKVGLYPPPSQSVAGFSLQTWDMMVTSIWARLMIYGEVGNKSFNNRAVSTLVNESFNSDLLRIDREGTAAPKGVNIPKLISKVIVVNKLKHVDDKEKGFHFVTTNENVYPVHVQQQLPLVSRQDPLAVFPNHAFDLKDVAHPTSRMQAKDVSRSMQPLRGVQNVRVHYTVNESLMEAEKRMPFKAEVRKKKK